MGRGRAKAKQVKVARRLKYSTDGTDLDRLRDELGVGSSPSSQDDTDGYDDPYEDPYEDETDEDDTDDESYAELAERYETRGKDVGDGGDGAGASR